MSHPVFKKKLLASCVAAACSASMSMVAQAQNAADEEVVVVGIRGSLEQSADIKREAVGVVDAISAEDIGKFPDTNLAESLQRITGVSINRVNGEGSEVTVRGFGGGNNMVTLNGRQLPTANVANVGGDQSSDFVTGTSRSFDFSNLASEGISALEVYKTGKATLPTGGIGATINVKTHRPLENPGFQASVGGKLVNDSGVVDGDSITPEVSGLVSWTNDSETVGVSLFASYQKRDSSSRSATVNYWNIRTYDFFSDPDNGLVTPGPAPSRKVEAA
jgi:TonB-dependent receptor